MSSVWNVRYLEEAADDLNRLDGSQRLIVLKAIDKVAQNPLPQKEGGYGKELGNHNKAKLAGLLKIKLRDSGIRIVYALKRTKTTMLIVVIGIRADEEVYKIADKRKIRYEL